MNGALDFSYWKLLALLALLVPVSFVSHQIGLGITRRIWYAVSRMVLQLLLVGLYLNYIFSWNNGFVNAGYFLLMILVSTFSSISSNKFKYRYFFLPVGVSQLLVISFFLLYFNVFVVGIDKVFDAMYVVPIGGMILGNSLSASIITLGNFYEKVHQDQNKYFFLSMVGASRFEALKPFLLESMLRSLTPNLATMTTIGIVSLPGMMTGQILGGSLPVVAIKYQIAIMIIIFTSRFFVSFVALLFSWQFCFDKRGALCAIWKKKHQD